ncbi:hypothetical protein BH11CYA1_BH11CYA1_46610 [soil metagenome]
MVLWDFLNFPQNSRIAIPVAFCGMLKLISISEI